MCVCVIAGITMASPTNGEIPVGTSAKNLVVGKGKGSKETTRTEDR